MRIGCFQSCACISSCCEFSKQALAVTVVKLNETFRNPDGFQKICIVTRSIIQGLSFYRQTSYLPQLVEVLNFTESFDFYGFCRLPRYFLHPYVPDRIDEYALLDQLEAILCHNWHRGIPDQKGQNRDPKVKEFAKRQLTAFLEQMVANDQDLRSADEVKNLLYNWLVQTLEAKPEKDFNPHDIDLQDLNVSLKATTWLEVLTDGTFIAIDIVCVPAFLQDWSLIDLSSYASLIGRSPIFSWACKYSLDDWIWGMMSVGYTLQFTLALRNYWQGDLTPDEKKDAKWQMAASAAEFLYCLTILQRKDPRLIVFCALCAKSLGLLRILLAPQPSFFAAKANAA